MIEDLTSSDWVNLREAEAANDKAGESAAIDQAERETNRERAEALENLLECGMCRINPPIIGWLVRERILTENGTDKELAKAMLAELRK